LHEYFIDKELYLIYDYIPGLQLRIFHFNIYASPWYIDYLIKVLLDVSSALRYIHSKGILHLDIKPDNILVTYPQNDITTNKANSNLITGYLIDYGLSCLKLSEDKYNRYMCINR